MRASRWLALVALLLGALLCAGAGTPPGPPGIPTGVTVTAGDTQVVVGWVALADDGGATISGYTVTAPPGGVTATVPGVAREAAVSGLSNGVAYRSP